MFTDGEFAPCPALNETPEYYKNNYNNFSYGKIGACKLGFVHCTASLICYTVIVFVFSLQKLQLVIILRHVAQTVALRNTSLKSCLHARKTDCLCSMPIL